MRNVNGGIIRLVLAAALVLPGFAAWAQEETAAARAPQSPPVTRAADLVTEEDAPRPALIPTAAFAGRSTFRSLGISPDGRRLAILRRVEDMSDVVVLDAATRAPLKRFTVDKDQSFEWFAWAGNDKLLVSVSYPGKYYGFPVRASRLQVRDLVTGGGWMLPVSRKALWGGDLVHMAEDGSSVLVAISDFVGNPPGVYRYELVPDAKPEKIVSPKTGVWSWYADDAGVVRLGMGWERRRLRVYYRKDAAAEFDLVGKLKADDERSRYWSVVQIVSGSDRGYVLEEGESGRVGVRLFDYAAGAPVETFYENPDWDVDELWLKDDGSPLAAVFTDDRERIHWFDPDRARLHARLGRALGTEDVHIVSRAKDDARMVVWGGNEADPGAVYIFTPAANTLDPIDNLRPELDFRQLVKPQPVHYRARDGLAITAYLTLPRGRPARGLPLIIMPHGGPFGVRDQLEYNDEVQFLANRGYAVLQPNFRGSGGYGDDFYEAGAGQVGRGMQDDLDDAMDWAVGEGIADPARVCVVGGSYGGYAALWAVLRNPERYVCAASWAGVTDWDKMLAYDKRYLTSAGNKSWQARIRGDEGFDLDAVSPYRLAEGLSRPVLLAHGTADENVPFKQYELMIAAAKKAPVPLTTLVVKDEGHSFSRPESEQKWYDALGAFLARHNPADRPGAERGVARPVAGDAK
ncbi:MAG: prolyl oligopeptidase family serine peptidase [Porphyrobacter sp.]|nr:prolyl oligopeptidase family serine peptidase [Porphyrobacter sp.]